MRLALVCPGIRASARETPANAGRDGRAELMTLSANLTPRDPGAHKADYDKGGQARSETGVWLVRMARW